MAVVAAMNGFEIRNPPYFYPDDEGGLRLRVQGPDGQPWWFQVSEAFAEQCVCMGGLHLKKLGHERRAARARAGVGEPQR